MGSKLLCSFGTIPGTLSVTSQTKCLAGNMLVGTVKDTAANVNISIFGMCTSIANPQVASATAAALGVLTPQPCMLAAVGIWSMAKPGILIDGTPCLSNEAQLICGNGAGTITILLPGQMKVMV